ncbi:uncharacterized protein [Venturia canescens]|uniref:uncharacterized protein n=1 Tax=Venturia canescens TaxID=32260 RepID=UPI001C9CFD62|nr:uncharacterized protein LOC122407937 [Venturia canescens]
MGNRYDLFFFFSFFKKLPLRPVVYPVSHSTHPNQLTNQTWHMPSVGDSHSGREEEEVGSLEHNTPSSTQTFVGGRECVRQAFQRRGIGEKAAGVMLNSISSNTIKQYQSSLKRLWEFRASQQNDVYKAETRDIIAFLSKRFEEGANYASLCADRSAIALILGKDFGKDYMISRFLKGVYKQKLPRPKYDSTWDTEQALQFLRKVSMEKASLREMGEKVATLLILSTAQRLKPLR